MADRRTGLPFPTEITEQVFSYLTNKWIHHHPFNPYPNYSDQEALKNARLTCRSFYGFASPLLFRRLVISPHLMQLATCMKVLYRPIFAEGVIELTYDANSSPFPRDPWRIWRVDERGRPYTDNPVEFPFCFNCVAKAPYRRFEDNSSHATAKPDGPRYQRLFKRLRSAIIDRVRPSPKQQPLIVCNPEHMKAQDDMELTTHLEEELILKDGHDQFCIGHLFRSLPKLRKLSYGCCDERWYPFLSMVCPVADVRSPPLPRHPPLPPRQFRYSLGSYDGNLKEFTGFTSITSTMTQDENHIEVFELRAPLELLRMNSTDANGTCEAFKNLTDLSLTFLFVERTISPPGQTRTPAMRRHLFEVCQLLLASHTAAMFGIIHGLQSMTLHLVPLRSKQSEYTEIMYHVPFRNMIGVTRWNSLKDISLRGFDFTAEEFINFLEDHLNTLASIELGQINLSQGDWKSIIAVCDRMPHLKALTLDHVQEYHRVDNYWMTYHGVRRSGAYKGAFKWERSMRLLN